MEEEEEEEDEGGETICKMADEGVLDKISSSSSEEFGELVGVLTEDGFDEDDGEEVEEDEEEEDEELFAPIWRIGSSGCRTTSSATFSARVSRGPLSRTLHADVPLLLFLILSDLLIGVSSCLSSST